MEGRLFRLRDDQWSRMAPLLPPATKTGGRHAKPHRPMVEAMIWVLRTGAPWRDLPRAYGPWQSVYTRWSRWSACGAMATLFGGVVARAGRRELLDRRDHRARAPRRVGGA
jgi:transposase